jgi:hypothetical protein
MTKKTTRLDLSEQVDRIISLSEDDTLEAIGLPAQLEQSNPEAYHSMLPRLAYSLILGKYAATQDYTSLELLDLHENLQYFAITRVGHDLTGPQEAMTLCDPGFLYQIMLKNLHKHALHKSSHEELSNFIGLYERHMNMIDRLKNAKSDAANRQVNFLNAQLSAFEDNYLLKTPKSQPDMYFRRYEAMLEYIATHDLSEQASKRMAVLIDRVQENLWTEIKSKESPNNADSLRKSAYEWEIKYKGTAAEQALYNLTRFIPGYSVHVEKEKHPLKKALNWIFS